MTTINPSRPTVSPPPRPPVATPASGSGGAAVIDPLKLLQKYKWLLGIAAAVGIVLGTVAHFAQMHFYPRYTSIAIFECFPVATDLETMDEVKHKDDLQRFQATQVQNLRSDDIIDKAVGHPRLLTDAPKWTAGFMRGGTFDRIAAQKSMRRNTKAGIVGDSNLVSLSFTATDPDEAAAVARIISRVYMEDLTTVSQGAIASRKDQIQFQIRAADSDLERLQNRRDRILADNSVDALDAQVNSANRQLELVDEKLSALSIQREDLQVHLSQLQNELASAVGINYSDTIRKRIEDDLEITNQKHLINRMEANLTALSERVGPAHRDRRRLEGELRSARQVLGDRRERLLREAFDAQLDSLRTMLRSIEAQQSEQMTLREEARRLAIEFTQIKQQIQDLDTQIDRLGESRARFSDSLKSIEVTTAGRSLSRVELRRPAQPPREVGFPKIYIMVPAGMMLVLGIVGGLVLLIEIVDQRVKGPACIAMIPRTRVLGLIAHASEDPSSPQRIETVFRDQPGGVLSEHFRQLRGTVLKRMQQSGHKSLVIMSGMPSSGATTVVTNLALSLAAAEHRVLVIDANFRRPAMHKHLGLPEAPGLADVLAGTRALADARQETEDQRLHVLTAGSPDNRMFERLGTDAMGELLREASSQYDMVLIDVAPAMIAGDALSIANRADASLLVVRAMGEKRGMVARLRNELSDSRGEFLGVLVNAARSAAGGYLRGNILATHSYRSSKAK